MTTHDVHIAYNLVHNIFSQLIECRRQNRLGFSGNYLPSNPMILVSYQDMRLMATQLYSLVSQLYAVTEGVGKFAEQWKQQTELFTEYGATKMLPSDILFQKWPQKQSQSI